jgi:hypothetical protein
VAPELAAYIRSLTPQHVLASAFGSHLIDFDAAAAACKLPIAYIGAVVPMANLSKFREFCPHLKARSWDPATSPRCWHQSRLTRGFKDLSVPTFGNSRFSAGKAARRIKMRYKTIVDAAFWNFAGAFRALTPAC